MEKYLLPTYNRTAISFVKGDGLWLETSDGVKYLDVGSGIAVNILGHCNKSLVSALVAQAHELWHTSNLYRISNQEKLAEILVKNTFSDLVFFTNSGAEATDCAIKMARKFHSQKGNARHEIISFEGSFHGRTLGAISTSNAPKMTEGFGPLLPGCKSIPLNDKDLIVHSISDRTAAVIIEPIQGEGGINIVPDHTLSLLRKLCDQHGVLLIFDEVQCGVGRTGKLFAHEWSGIFPDIMTIAKGIGGGMPLGACLASNSAALGMGLGSHGSTYGGNPLACAVGIEVLNQVLEMEFLPNVRRIAGQWFQKLSTLVDEYEKVFAEVKGMGLMLGLKTKVNNQLFIEEAFKNNLLLVPAADNTVRLLPPLNINKSEVDLVIKLLKKSAEGLIK